MNTIERAFAAINRRDFVPEDLRSHAYYDTPLPIGFNQTISQPTTVRRMLDWLGANPGDKVLDIGSGSGWTTALLSKIVGPSGEVFAVERIPELVKFGKDNCEKVGISNAKFFRSGKVYGLNKYAPYNRILVSAAATKLPDELLEQLEVGGKLIIPVQNDILEITKNTADAYDRLSHPGYIFVPLV